MPYIERSQRPPFFTPISAAIAAIGHGKTPLEQVEMAAWWCRHVVRKFAGLPDEDTRQTHLWTKQLDPSLLRSLKMSGDVAHNLLGNGFRENDPAALLDVAGKINYCLSAVAWGFMGDAPGTSSARYGARSMFAEMLRTIRSEIDGDRSASNSVLVRKTTMLKAVLSDVLDELYRRKTSCYENNKRDEHGDVWPLVEHAPKISMSLAKED